MKLTLEEKTLLDEHIKEQKEIRKVEKEWEGLPDFEQRLDLITQQSFFALGEFLVKSGIHGNKEKLTLAWEYLGERL